MPDCWARTSFAAGRSCRCSAPARSRPRIGCPDGSDCECLPWRKTPPGAAMVREKLPTIQGVQSVKLNPATGSVLIVYREDQVRPELLFAAVVRLMNLDAELKRTPAAGRHAGIEGNPGQRESDGVRPDGRADRSLVGRAHSVGRHRHPKSVGTRDAGLSGGAHAGLVGPGLAAGRPAIVVA